MPLPLQNAATCVTAHDGFITQMFSATIATPATCAVARSMNTIPRFNTSIPRGACSAVHRRPVTNAGMTISKISVLITYCFQPIERYVKEIKQVVDVLQAANGKR